MNSNNKIIVRFAPSPTGKLHLGHLFSILFNYYFAKENNGKFLLRIEDIDFTRCKKEHIKSILNDLDWLGIKIDDEIIYQSQRLEIYKKYLKKLKPFTFKCNASRKDIKSFNPLLGFDGYIYPEQLKQKKIATQNDIKNNYSLRLNITSFQSNFNNLYFQDLIYGKKKVLPQKCGDFIIARKDIKLSYHLCSVIDDYLQSTTHIIRGYDLYKQTNIHRIIQKKLNFNSCIYLHHHLILNEQKQKLSKSSQKTNNLINKKTIRYFRKNNYKPQTLINKYKKEIYTILDKILNKP